ncbi:MAG TPA: crotonase/enoyl-CoA hydratase family protein [Solirubrobacteraceae bacterium]|jgi:enoyl-CoA hydratase|nr:crotonase/enoyl-CoA hydratase family protein [Solirubrobacteraceae bacterium]
MSDLVSYELEGRIATIAMDDGKVNAFSIAMLQALHAAFDRAERDNAVVVLTGREGCFSAGFDLKVFAGGDVERVLEMLRLGATLAERVLGFQTPVLLACGGHTVAAGAFLALAADVRIGAEGDFRVGLNEVQIGLTVPWFVIELARQRLHPGHFARAVINAATYSPTDAVAVGYFDRVVPAGELHAASRAEAARLSELDQAAHAATKLRARSDALIAIRKAIESELTVAGLGAAQAPQS